MKTLLSALLLLPLLAFAAEPKLQLGSQKIEGVTLADAGEFPLGDASLSLKRASAGLRYKKVVFVKAKVYVAQLFLADPGKYKRSEAEALPSLAEQKGLAMRLTFLRDVDAKKIEGAFREGLEESGIKDDPEMKGFLAAALAGGESKTDSTILVVADRPAAGKERLAYTGPNGKTTVLESSGGLINKVFSLWLGKMSDSGLESLKKDLTQ